MTFPKSPDLTKFVHDRKTNRSLLAIGAHADDLELSMGGTLCKYHDLGYEIGYVMATNNMSGGWSTLQPDGTITSRTPAWSEIMPQRKLEADAGAAYFGTKCIHLDYPQKHYMREDGVKQIICYGAPRPDCVPEGIPTILTAAENKEAVERVTNLILEHNAEAVITHGGQMNNAEHFGTQQLVTRAYWKAVEQNYEGMLLNWHDLGVSVFGDAYRHWDSFVDISDYFDKKLECSAIHACQKPDVTRLDWPQNGAACGCAQAEVFTIVGRFNRTKQPGDFTLEIIGNSR